LPASPFQE